MSTNEQDTYRGGEESMPQRSRVPAIVAAAIGGVALVGVAGAGIIYGLSGLSSDRDEQPTAGAASPTSGTTTDPTSSPSQSESSTSPAPTGGPLSADTNGVTEVEIHTVADSFEVVFADVSEATLQVDGNQAAWSLVREKDEIQVRGPQSGTGDSVTLSLPAALASQLDLDLNVVAGAAEVDGNFDDLDIDLTAGQVSATGAARSVDVEVRAGDASIALADVAEAGFAVIDGNISAELTGSTPIEVEIEAQGGALDLALPSDQYNVVTEGGGGVLDNRLETSGTSSHLVEVELHGGVVTLR